MYIIECLKKIYKKILDSNVITSVFFAGYFLVQKMINKECRKNMRKFCIVNKKQKDLKTELKELCIATICDDMTWQNLKKECVIYSLTPHNWREILSKRQIDIFFCESAWLGIKEQKYCWHGKIYRNKKLLFENRKDLLDILKFCKKNSIPTIFWNKEDPAFIDSDRYDFKDTALKFDYIFTTAQECVHVYQAEKHKNVDVLPFGFSPYLFNPLNCYPKENSAIFAGSWYEEETERCCALKKIFDKVINNKIPLIIYDRQTGSKKEGRIFPEEYMKYIKNSVPFETLGPILKKSKYAINVNTITDSQTMFARRVLELMAMNTFVLSNNSVGMRNLFSDRICLIDEDIPDEVQELCLKNMEYVFCHRTNEKMLSDAFQKVGVLKNGQEKGVTIVRIDCLTENIQDVRDYVFLYDGISELPQFNLMIPHFCYLPENCGIRVSESKEFILTEDIDNKNVLFSREMFKKVLHQPECKTSKYLLGVSGNNTSL